MIALSGILLCIILCGNTGAIAREIDVEVSYESYEPHRSYQRRSLDETSIGEIIDEPDEPTRCPGSCTDARAVAKLLKGDELGFWEKIETTTSTFSKCTRAELLNVKAAYTELYGDEKFGRMLGERYDEFKAPHCLLLMLSLITPLEALIAYNVKKAVEKKDYNKIGEYLTPLNANEVSSLARALAVLYGRQSVNDLMSFINTIPDEFKKRLIYTQTFGIRSSNNTVDFSAACKDAERIEHELKVRSNEKLWYNATHDILTTVSFPQLGKINECFKSRTGYSIVDTIVMNLLYSPDLIVYSGILLYAENKAAYFAQLLRDALRGSKTDIDTIIFIVAWRADIDLGNVKTAYQAMRQESLYKDVSENTSGKIRDLLLTVIGE